MEVGGGGGSGWRLRSAAGGGGDSLVHGSSFDFSLVGGVSPGALFGLWPGDGTVGVLVGTDGGPGSGGY